MNQNYEKKYGFRNSERFEKKIKGLTKDTVRKISEVKREPEWMTKFRLDALDIFFKKEMPKWGPDLSEINFRDIVYYMKPKAGKSSSWDEVPEDIKNTFDRLGIPEAERKFLGGVGAQYESEVIYHNLRKDLESRGVIFTDTDTALKEHSGIFKKYFSKIVPPDDNKFSALNSAVWSGGSFVYIPKGIKVEVPLQAYFRINARNMGQFERTLIIVDEGASVHYVEGCTAPIYSTASLHSAVVEVIALKDSKVRYTTIQNWSSNVYNLVTKRAHAYENSVVEWIDGNIGSKVSMKYPSVYLLGKNARADLLSASFAGKGQVQDVGGKVLHFAPFTSSKVISKSVSRNGGVSSYRGLIHVAKGAKQVKSNMRCDALMLDNVSKAESYPSLKVNEVDVEVAHEATVGRISDDSIFYLMSRGLTEQQAVSMIVLGFVSQFAKELPMEYAVELNRLVQIGGLK